MLKFRTLFVLATAAALGTACARFGQASAAGNVIDPADAATTVVLHVDNMNTQPMELRAIMNGQSKFIGSVGGQDSTSILLDPSWFPTGFLYVAAIPADGRGRAIAGPLAAAKGDKINFSVQPALDQSRALVVR
ncbi:MAG: hypothetical protein JWM41_3693 [Gemmatimonadetes bacterium]|nr:hypothetical protein [Gemmatimonadota bacterium]